MTTSDHVRSPRARLALAAGGIGVLAALAVAADAVAGLIGGARGTLAGFLLLGAVFAGCWIVHRVRGLLHPARPARVRLPEPAADDLKPANALT